MEGMYPEPTAPQMVTKPPPYMLLQPPPPVVVQQSPPPVVVQQSPPPVVVQQPSSVVVSSGMGGRTCPQCNGTLTTKSEKKMSTQGWIWVAVLFFIGCWPWCLIPFCVDSCKNTENYCSQCNAYLGGRQA